MSDEIAKPADLESLTLEQIQERTAERIAAREAKRGARQAERERLEAIKELETEEALDAAVEEHGERKVARIDYDGGSIIIKRPTQALYKKFIDGKKQQSDEQLVLASSCVLYPSKEEFNRLVQELPGLLSVVANAAVRLAGFRSEEISSK
jgi:hypothetical protein